MNFWPLLMPLLPPLCYASKTLKLDEKVDARIERIKDLLHFYRPHFASDKRCLHYGTCAGDGPKNIPVLLTPEQIEEIHEAHEQVEAEIEDEKAAAYAQEVAKAKVKEVNSHNQKKAARARPPRKPRPPKSSPKDIATANASDTPSKRSRKKDESP